MTIDKVQSEIIAYWFAIVIFFIILGIYGKQMIEWLLIALYELFIKGGSLK